MPKLINTNYSYKIMNSPVGQLKLIASDKGLAAILWENDAPQRTQIRTFELSSNHPILLKAEQELSEYFSLKRNTFSVPLDLVGTEFQKQVWHALLTIPFGQTRTYGQIATLIGKPLAARAVGAAAGRNPISIVVPCHRMIGSSGKLVGFAGGLNTKTHLLGLEKNK